MRILLILLLIVPTWLSAQHDKRKALPKRNIGSTATKLDSIWTSQVITIPGDVYYPTAVPNYQFVSPNFPHQHIWIQELSDTIVDDHDYNKQLSLQDLGEYPMYSDDRPTTFNESTGVKLVCILCHTRKEQILHHRFPAVKAIPKN